MVPECYLRGRESRAADAGKCAATAKRNGHGCALFRTATPPRSVAWKAYARGAPLMVAHYESPVGLQRILNLDPLQAQTLEQKLSQLTLWVLECERLGEQYALQLPGHSQAPGHGVAHRRVCLEALALHGL